ncbi:MAG: hypothetical protein WD995_02535, partial [Gemmatimonadota bacterium]
MIRIPTLALVLGVTSWSCGGEPRADDAGEAAFRVRADVAAPLDADHGWAGALNENVTVEADRPFRLRFEVRNPVQVGGNGRMRLEVRRNQGEWTAVEAHDFPLPARELEVTFETVESGA